MNAKERERIKEEAYKEYDKKCKSWKKGDKPIPAIPNLIITATSESCDKKLREKNQEILKEFKQYRIGLFNGFQLFENKDKEDALYRKIEAFLTPEAGDSGVKEHKFPPYLSERGRPLGRSPSRRTPRKPEAEVKER